LSISQNNIKLRLKNREREKIKLKRGKKTSSVLRFRRTAPLGWLPLADRQLIIELCKALANKMRVASLVEEIGSLGGFAKPHRWKSQHVERIRALRKELNKVRREIANAANEREQFVRTQKVLKFKGCYVADHAPQYLAAHLEVNVLVVYRVLRKFARTGDVKFFNDFSEEEKTRLRGFAHLNGARRKREINNATHVVAPESRQSERTKKAKVPSKKSLYFRNEINDDISPLRMSKHKLKFSLSSLDQYVAKRCKISIEQYSSAMIEYEHNRARDRQITAETFAELSKRQQEHEKLLGERFVARYAYR
jgi:hypothetical protein